MERLPGEWAAALAEETGKPYYAELAKFVDGAYASETCYPPAGRVFEAFRLTPPGEVKAVIIGQDPYHGAGQAHGLCFSVLPPAAPPPSLVNIFKELRAEYGGELRRTSGDLTAWAEQGVLMLNSTLTVADGRPLSHAKRGWERFTDAVVAWLDSHRDNLVFLLWGANAKKKAEAVDRSRHLVLEAAHPSPLSASRGFFGCGHFRLANDYLAAHGVEPIDWLAVR